MLKNGQAIASKLFSLDNKVMRTFSLSLDLVIVNLLFLLGSLPIVTIGVSLSAMYSVTMKMVKKENGAVTKEFITAYRANLKQGLLFGLLAFAIALFLYLDYVFLQQLMPTQTDLLKIIFIALALLGYLIYLYIFPLIARYVYTTKEVYQTALKLSLSNLPWNLLLLALNIPLIVMMLSSGITMLVGCLLMIVTGFAYIAYAQSVIFRKIFAKYE